MLNCKYTRSSLLLGADLRILLTILNCLMFDIIYTPLKIVVLMTSCLNHICNIIGVGSVVKGLDFLLQNYYNIFIQKSSFEQLTIYLLVNGVKAI